MALTNQDGPDKALSRLFIIRFDGILFHPGLHARDNGIAAGRAQGTDGSGGILHNPVAVGPVEAELDMAVSRPPYRELGLVAEEGWEG